MNELDVIQLHLTRAAALRSTLDAQGTARNAIAIMDEIIQGLIGEWLSAITFISKRDHLMTVLDR